VRFGAQKVRKNSGHTGYGFDNGHAEGKKLDVGRRGVSHSGSVTLIGG